MDYDWSALMQESNDQMLAAISPRYANVVDTERLESECQRRLCRNVFMDIAIAATEFDRAVNTCYYPMPFLLKSFVKE